MPGRERRAARVVVVNALFFQPKEQLKQLGYRLHVKCSWCDLMSSCVQTNVMEYYSALAVTLTLNGLMCGLSLCFVELRIPFKQPLLYSVGTVFGVH